MKSLLIVISILFSGFSFAQTNSTIRTGRPGQSIGAYVVGEKILQVQSGFNIEDNKSIDSTVLNNVLRYGINEKFEISGVLDLHESRGDRKGLDNKQLGVRLNLIDQKESFIRGLCVQLRNRFKGSGDFKRNRNSQVFISAIKFPSYEGFSFVMNINMSTNGFDNKLQKRYTFNVGHDVTDKLSVFLEPYGTYKNNKTINSINTGAAYLYNSDLAFDVSLGGDVSTGQSSKFISFGISFRSSLI